MAEMNRNWALKVRVPLPDRYEELACHFGIQAGLCRDREGWKSLDKRGDESVGYMRYMALEVAFVLGEITKEGEYAGTPREGAGIPADAEDSEP